MRLLADPEERGRIGSDLAKDDEARLCRSDLLVEASLEVMPEGERLVASWLEASSASEFSVDNSSKG